MNGLIPYIQQMIQNGGTALVPSRALTAKGTSVVPQSGPPIIDGEWSEVPRGLPSGGAVANSGTGLQRTYGQFSEVPKELSGPSAGGGGLLSRMGGLASRAGTALAAEGGSMASMANPLLAAIMGSMQGDVLNNRPARMYGSPLPASPTPPVTSGGPMPPAATPTDQVANRFGAMQPPAPMTPNQQVADRSGQFQPPSSGGGLPGWLTGAQLTLGPSGGFPQAQQAMAYAPPNPHRGHMTVPTPGVNPNGSIAGAQGPTSVGGAPLQPQMGFFQRNAAMMRDPVTGGYIDPQGAARAQASMRHQDQGGLIQRMLSYLGNKQS